MLKKLVLVYDLYLATPYSQPSEHHERVFDKNNSCKKNLYVKSYVEIRMENYTAKDQFFIKLVGFKTSIFSATLK